MQAKRTQRRETKYSKAVQEYVGQAGHATNAELLVALRQRYAALSATTIHRITARMVERAELQLAPADNDNAMRFDANLAPHDHFMCLGCGILRDADIKERVRPILEESIGNDCSISGRFVVSGLCRNCKLHTEEK
jgi:Fe2+ or Zn2+ uptake regulation protein